MEILRRYGIKLMIHPLDFFYPSVIQDFYSTLVKDFTNRLVLRFNIPGRAGFISEDAIVEAFRLRIYQSYFTAARRQETPGVLVHRPGFLFPQT